MCQLLFWTFSAMLKFAKILCFSSLKEIQGKEEIYFANPTSGSITHVPLIQLTSWLTDCNYLGIPHKRGAMWGLKHCPLWQTGNELGEGYGEGLVPGKCSWHLGNWQSHLSRGTPRAGKLRGNGVAVHTCSYVGIQNLNGVKSGSSQIIGLCSYLAKKHKPTFPKGK